MKILSIETSADETAVSVVRAVGDFPEATYTILGNALFSQVEIHQDYGGIYPAIAKREHAKTLPFMLTDALKEAGLLKTKKAPSLTAEQLSSLTEILHREPGLSESLINFLETHERPELDLIGVTSGPGLEPALWVGINFAKALALSWDLPVVPVNHMEGHLLVSVFDGAKLPKLKFPALGLLISGGHTELDLMDTWHNHTRVGETRDDAAGEAFDKVARMLGFSYPGGPALDHLALTAGKPDQLDKTWSDFKLPRPMIGSGDLDFSFSGLKTAVRYQVADRTLTEAEAALVAREFVSAVSEVLIKKCDLAIDRYGINSLIIGGGVSASRNITAAFKNHYQATRPDLALYIPNRSLATDNAIMIALTTHSRASESLPPTTAVKNIVADGNRTLG